MPLKLEEAVRLEVVPEGSRAVTRIFVGERELPATTELRVAVARLCIGERALPFELLQAAGVLVDVPDAPPPPESLALSGSAAIGIRLRPGASTVRTRAGVREVSVLPENSLPIGGFVPPDVLGPLQELARVVRNAWRHLLSASHSRGVLVDPERARTLLFDLAVERIGADPALAAVLRVEGQRLVPVRPLQQDAFAYQVVGLDFLDDRRPERATDRVRHTLLPDALPAVAAVLGALGRGATTNALQAVAGDDPMARRVLASLTGTSILEPVPEPVEVPPGCVVHLGHATLLANLGGAHVLIDPWFPPGSVDDDRMPLSVARLPPLAGIFFTHHHWDHVNPGTLARLDKTVPVYVPSTPAGRPLVPRTAALLREFGFQDVRELAHDAVVEVGQGQVVAAPFTGEDPTDVGWIGNTYVLVHEGRAAWVHVDSGPDRHGRSTVSDGTAAALASRFGTLDPVFGTRRQERGTMVEHTWEFLLADPDAWVRPTENCCNDAAFLGALTEAAGGSLVLYSEGGAPWYPATTDFLRPGPPDALDRVQVHLWDDLEAIRSACAGSVALSVPGDMWRIGGGQAGRLQW